MLQRSYRTAVTYFIHDAGVQCNVAVPVGETAQAYCLDLRVGFGDLYPCLYGVQRPAALFEHFPGCFVGR